MEIRKLLFLLYLAAVKATDPPDVVLHNATASIIGGGPASTTAYPFHAISDAPFGSCGSSLIWSDVLLTSAGCWQAFNSTSYNAYIGGTTNFGLTAPEVIPIKSWIAHPDWCLTCPNYNGDLMLVFLASASTASRANFNFNSAIPAVGEQLSVIGFGRTVDGVPGFSSTLKEAKERVITDATCAASYSFTIASSATFCTTNVTGFSCGNDSGGPIMNGVRTIVGLTSFGTRSVIENGVRVTYCTRSPRAYTRVSTYSAWIFAQICASSAFKPSNCPASPMTTPAPTKAPVRAITKAPVVISTKAPVLFVQTKAPVIPLQTKAPVLAATKAPIQVATKAPVQVTKAPVQVTKAPVQVTKAPIQITKAPIQITKAPVQVTKAPIQITKAPIQITKAPAIPPVTKAPMVADPPVKAPQLGASTKAPIVSPVAPQTPIVPPVPTKAPSVPTLQPQQFFPGFPVVVPVVSPVLRDPTPPAPTLPQSPPTPTNPVVPTPTTACSLCPGSTTLFSVHKFGLLGRCRSRCVTNPVRLLSRRWKCGLC